MRTMPLICFTCPQYILIRELHNWEKELVTLASHSHHNSVTTASKYVVTIASQRHHNSMTTASPQHHRSITTGSPQHKHFLVMFRLYRFCDGCAADIWRCPSQPEHDMKEYIDQHIEGTCSPTLHDIHFMLTTGPSFWKCASFILVNLWN